MSIAALTFPVAPNHFEPLLTPAEAGDLLRIHPKTVIRLAREGSLPALRLGKHWRFRRSDLGAWVESRVSSNRQPSAE
jgi:excisionase family DNA binding protein